MTSRVTVRSARPGDGSPLAALLADYLRETFPGHTGSTAEVLERDVLSGEDLRVLFAERSGRTIGFVGWRRIYDIHWGKAGVQVEDLYVRPEDRGLGVAMTLIARVCADAQRTGASFLYSSSFDRSTAVGRFYERIAVALDSAICHCSGRAFRRLAELNGESPKDIARSLPPKEWNYEP